MTAPVRRTIHRRNFVLRIAPFALIALVSALVIASQLRASPATTTGPDYSDLVLNLTFDNDSGSTVTDSSKYQHNGTATGTMVTDGKFGSGRSFNGTSDYIVVPHADALSPTSAMTVEAWVYVEPGSSMKILQKRGVFTDTAGGYMLGAWFGNPRGYGFEVYDSSQHLVNTSPERLPTTQTWTHVTATYDGSALKLYENGQLVGTTVWSGAITRSTKDLWIGMQPDNSLMPFKGKMDEVRIYNRALSAEEVSCSYEGKVWASGSCQTSANRAPVVVSASGPSTLEESASGTWTVKAHDPDGGALTFRVDWGSGSPEQVTSSSSGANQTYTFTHTYATAGSFAPSFTASDQGGASPAITSALTVTRAADTQAPGLPTAVTAEEITASSARVAWLAPSDNVGVTSYQVRYRQGTSFADVDWASATTTSAVPSTVVAGQRVSTVLSGLAANTDYGVGVKACDAAGNCSTIAAATFRTLAETQTVGADGLIGHWKFDGNGNNEVSGGPSAATVGGATFRSDGGKIGGYAYIPVSGDSVKIPYRSTFDLPSTFTVAIWFRQRADRSFLQNLVSKGSGQNYYNFYIFRQLWNQYNFGPIITGYTSSRTWYWTQTSNQNQLSHDVWHHVVFTKDAAQSAYYLDGSLTHSSQQTDPAVTPANDIVVGGSAVDTDFDDLRIYNRALSSDESRTLGGFPVPPTADTTPPGISTAVTAEEITTTSTRIAWLAPSDNVGVTSYQVRYRQGTSFANVDWENATSTSAVSSTVAAGQRVSTVLSGLAASMDYGVGVKACDAAGNCSTIAAATFRTLAGGTGGTTDTVAPDSITSIAMMRAGDVSADLQWIVPADNIGVTRFELRYRSSQTTPFVETDWTTISGAYGFAATAPGTSFSYTLSGLNPSTEYAVGVKAYDAAGNASRVTSVTFRTAARTSTDGSGGLPTGNAAIRVLVRDQSGVAVVGATVRLMNQGSSGSMSGTSDSSGAYTFTGRAAGSYNMDAFPSSGRTDLVSPLGTITVTLTGGMTTEHTVTLPNRTSTTTTTTGTGTTTTTGTGTTTTTTGTTGTTSSGGGSGTTTSTTTTTTTGTATLRVIVRDASAQPVSGAFVGLSFPGGGAASPTTTTGADGIATFSNIAAGSYHLGVSPPTTRADLGSIASQPIALALSATTDLAVSLPVRTVTTNATGGTTANAAALCGTVYDPDRNILSGITIGLSRGGGDMALLGTSALTGADGRYCFATLAPGTYVIGATTPAHRTDLSPPGTVVITLAAGTSGTQDLVFGRTSFIATPGVPPPAPPPTAPPPLPVIERCVRDAFGPELYGRMRTGKYKPKAEEYERARHCFNLTVIADHRPVETPIGAPVIPTPSVIVIPGPVAPPSIARPPEFDDRCEVRELPRVKRGLQRIGRELTVIEREITRLQTAKVTVPIDTGLLIARARDLLKQVQDAKTCEDAFTAGEELPELLQQLRMSIERVARLRFAPRVLTSFDREVKRFLDRTRVSIRRLERSKFAIAEFRARFAEAEQQLKECRASAQAALTAVDPELFEDTVRSCFEILDEAREIQSLTDALANARAFLTGQVNVTLRKATRVIRDLERRKRDASEVKQFADALKQRRDEALAALRAGGLAKDELVDLMEEVITAFGDLDDAFERALGTSTYEEVVGKAPPPSIAAPKLEKPAEEFFERE